MQRYLVLIRREFWEHRALWLTPTVIGGLCILAVAMFFVTAGLMEGVGFKGLVAGIRASGDVGSATGTSVLLLAPFTLFNLSLIFVVAFYAMDALYAERKDRSVLFWRSLPVTDTETVITKHLVAGIGAPLTTFLVLAITQLAILVLATIFVWIGDGSAAELVWGPVPLAKTWAFSFYTLLAGSLWALPFVAWFLLCSAYVRKSPFLWSVLPFALIPILERLAFGTSHFSGIVFGHIANFASVSYEVSDDGIQIDADQGLEAIASEFNPARLIDLGGLLTSPNLWGGIAVAALLTVATIYVRRYRPETES